LASSFFFNAEIVAQLYPKNVISKKLFHNRKFEECPAIERNDGFVVGMRMSRPWDANTISKINQTRRGWRRWNRSLRRGC
jgi:hypothetical protein